MRPPSSMFGSKIRVERYAGSGAYGDTYHPATDEWASIEGGAKQIRNANGEITVSARRVHVAVSDNGPIPVESKVTKPGVWTAEVIAVDEKYSRGDQATYTTLELG